MRLLILCNNVPGVIRSALSGRPESDVNWLDSVLAGLRGQSTVSMEVLCLGHASAAGALDEHFSYLVFPCKSHKLKLLDTFDLQHLCFVFIHIILILLENLFPATPSNLHNQSLLFFYKHLSF